jgi:two-component system LytT family response regulator
MQIEASPVAGATQLTPPPPPPLSAAQNQLASDPADTRVRLRVLVADDDAVARDVLRRLLQKEPEVELVGFAASSRDAVELINRLGPDLLFLDVQMPEFDGFEVLNQIRCPRPPTVVFVTANEAFAQRASEVHALDFIVKPCTRQRLQSVLQRARERTGSAVPLNPNPNPDPTVDL